MHATWLQGHVVMVLAVLDCDWYAKNGTSGLAEASEDITKQFQAIVSACAKVKVLSFVHLWYMLHISVTWSWSWSSILSLWCMWRIPGNRLLATQLMHRKVVPKVNALAQQIKVNSL